MLFSEVYGTYFDVLSEILEKAAANIRKFHSRQVRNSFIINVNTVKQKEAEFIEEGSDSGRRSEKTKDEPGATYGATNLRSVQKGDYNLKGIRIKQKELLRAKTGIL